MLMLGILRGGRYNIDMNHTEREPIPVASFRDLAYQLPDDQGLFLSRNSVRRQYVDRATGAPEPVHYEGIDTLSVDDYPVEGILVSDEFRSIATWVRAETECVRRPPAFPMLTVINNTTGAAESRIIDVSELIVNDTLPIYATPAEYPDEGEVLRMDFMPLIKSLVEATDVQPGRAMLLKADGMQALRDVDLSVTTHLAPISELQGGDRVTLPVEARGETALSLLQMDVADAFVASDHKAVMSQRKESEVVLQVGVRPDLQTLLLSMIDIIESRNEHLYCYKDSVTTGELAFVLSVVNDNFVRIVELAREASLDVALYNAYRMTWESYPEARS